MIRYLFLSVFFLYIGIHQSYGQSFKDLHPEQMKVFTQRFVDIVQDDTQIEGVRLVNKRILQSLFRQEPEITYMKEQISLSKWLNIIYEAKDRGIEISIINIEIDRKYFITELVYEINNS